MGTKQLWIIRHAKSSWEQSGQRDFDRGLNPRGLRDGARMQAYLASLNPPARAPQWLWCSTARRARATAEFVRAGAQVDDDCCVYRDDLYHASASTLLDVLQQTPAEIASVAIVAHNPGLTDLANCLGDAPVTHNLPTFGIARFRFEANEPGQFADLAFGQARFEDLITPKGLNG